MILRDFSRIALGIVAACGDNTGTSTTTATTTTSAGTTSTTPTPTSTEPGTAGTATEAMTSSTTAVDPTTSPLTTTVDPSTTTSSTSDPGTSTSTNDPGTSTSTTDPASTSTSTTDPSSTTTDPTNPVDPPPPPTMPKGCTNCECCDPWPISWAAVPGATHYKVRWKCSINPEQVHDVGDVTMIGDVCMDIEMCNGMCAFTVGYVRVEACNADGCSAPVDIPAPEIPITCGGSCCC